MTLTLTPPIFQLNLAPGDVIRSYLKIVNGNTYDVTLHSSVENFQPKGESGAPIFDQASATNPNPRTLASWITLGEKSTFAHAGNTVTIPFTVHIPKDAEPGGHYAGILVGTSPMEKIPGSGIGVGSFLSSLILVRVAGDVNETGAIRDFFADPWFVEAHNASFTLRFENKGNVHLIPQGEIVIYNMWGKERGKIAINDTNTFGNVLPGSTRKFTFDWEGEAHPFDIGRYKAVTTLAYGADGRHTVFRTAYFWVVPWKEMLMVLAGLALLVLLIGWSVRRYVRKVIQMEKEKYSVLSIQYSGNTDDSHAPKSKNDKKADSVAIPAERLLTLAAFVRPLRSHAHVATGRKAKDVDKKTAKEVTFSRSSVGLQK